MDPQMALPRAFLLLLLLYLLLRGGHSYPLWGLGPALEPSEAQKLLDHLQDKVSELQEEQVTPEPPQKDSDSEEAWDAKQAHRGSGLGPTDPLVPTMPIPKLVTAKPGIGCFGRKLDRISHSTRLGCNVVS